MVNSAIQRFSKYGLIDNEYVKLLHVIKEALASGIYEEINITVGYLFLSGLLSIREELEKFFENGGVMRIIMGSITNKETYETLAAAYQSLKDLREEYNRRSFSRLDLDEEIEAYSKTLGAMEQKAENQEFIEELANWIRDGKLRIRIFTKDFMHAKTYIFKTKGGSSISLGSVGSSNFSLAGLHANTELNALITGPHFSNLEAWFEKMWKASEDFDEHLLNVISSSWVFQNPGRFPLPYLVLIRGLMELYGPLEEVGRIAAPSIVEQLYDFQRDAVLRAIDIVNRYNGVLISDVVGLGKSFIGLALLQHFSLVSMFSDETYRPRVAVFAPPKLVGMWRRYLRRFQINGVVFSSGWLLRGPNSDGEPPPRILQIMNELEDVGVILVDEAHRFSNPNTNSYANLQRLIGDRRVILLTATPYRKGFEDIVRQIQLFMPGEYHKLPISPARWTDVIKAVNEGLLDPAYVLREVMVRRTRRDIVKLYGERESERCFKRGEEKECFPERKLETVTYDISSVYSLKYADQKDVEKIIVDFNGDYYDGRSPESYKNIYEVMLAGIRTLRYARYDLYHFVKEHLRDVPPYRDLKRAGMNLRGLMKTHYLKRLESSAHAFYLSLKKSMAITETFLKFIEKGYLPIGEEFEDALYMNDEDPRPLTDEEVESFIGEIATEYGDVEKSPLRTYKLNNFRVRELKDALKFDLEKLKAMVNVVAKVHREVMKEPWKDAKLRTLAMKIDQILSSSGKRKVLVFSEFEDTVKWVYRGLMEIVKNGKVEHPELWENKIGYASSSVDVEAVAAKFSPRSMSKTSLKAQEVLASGEKEIDVLITTDVLSEGMNLQDANYVINYDIHWTPYKIIQRIGRVDRIGSEYDVVHVINFLPETELDRKLNLIEKVRKRAEELMTTLGEDGKLITEEDRLNPSAMEAIYGGNLEKLERHVDEGEISITTNASKLLKEFVKKRKADYEKLRKTISLRSITKAGIKKTIAFFVCSNGINPQYYTYEYVNGKWKRIYLSLDYFINNVKENSKPVEDFDMRKYYDVAHLALEEYRRTLEEMSSVRGYSGRTKNKGLLELLRKLREISRSPAKDEGIKKLASQYRDLLMWGIANIPAFKNDLKRLTARKQWKRKKDEEILQMVKNLLDIYAIPVKKKKAESILRSRSANYLAPHITAGLILIPESD